MKDNRGIEINYQFKFKLSKEEAPKLGRCIATIVLFFFTNIISVIAGIIFFIQLDNYTAYNILCFAFILSFSIGFMALAIFFIHKYILITVMQSGYKHITPFFKTISAFMAEQYTTDEKFQEKINNTLDFRDIYDKNATWIIRKALGFFVDHLPFVDFIKNLSPAVNGKDAQAVSESIYSQMDDYIVNKLFSNNNMKVFFILYPINIVVNIVLLYLL
ncbi:MAG: hypothetical protein LBD46_06365 [Endomicrobium sp.]|jgi:hypothetical protein|nr:hypothetical protein [Endomicrobium sp.]